MKRLITAAFALSLAAGSTAALADPQPQGQNPPPPHQGGQHPQGGPHQQGGQGGQGGHQGGQQGGGNRQGGQGGGQYRQPTQQSAPTPQYRSSGYQGQGGRGYQNQAPAIQGQRGNNGGYQGQTYQRGPQAYEPAPQTYQRGTQTYQRGTQSYQRGSQGYDRGSQTYQRGPGAYDAGRATQGNRYSEQSGRGGARPGFQPGNHALRGRDEGRQWFDPGRYRHEYYGEQRFRVGAYAYPRGWYEQNWSYGEYLPNGWYGASYYLNSDDFGLPYAPIGCEWVRVGRDALLVDVYTGEVLSVYRGIFW